MLRRNHCFDGLNVISDIVRRFTENTDSLTFDEKEKNYLFAIELTDCVYSMMDLAILYEKKTNWDMALKYYEMALEIDESNVIIRYNYADMYFDLYHKFHNNIYDDGSEFSYLYANGLYHLSRAANLNDPQSMFDFITRGLSLPEHKCSQSTCQGVIKYLSMLIDHKQYKKDYSFTLLQKLRILKFCDQLSGSLPQNIINEKNRLRNDRDISIYKNKIQLFTKLNHICECQICYDESLQIDLTCGHCFCTNCYVKIHGNPCPICKL
jgi:tetratricopeptide (TPR) repeat protein